MKQSISRLIHFASAAALTAVSCAATADEAEIFVGLGNAVTAERPNILFIIDTSGSMSTNVTTQVPFNPSTVYPGACSSRRVYFESGTDAQRPAELHQWQLGAARRIQVPDRARPDGDIRLLCRDARRPVARRRSALAQHQRQYRGQRLGRMPGGCRDAW